LLERIIFNLISNAVRYTQRGGLVVGCRRRDSGLRIEVWDTGSGIPSDQHEKIFGEFYRLGELDKGHRAGLGLGLAIVDRLCRLLEHPVDVRSVLDRGSVFAVTVPVVSAPIEIPGPPAPARSRFDVSKGKLVVVVDDDPFALEGMDGILRSWGCRVITADTDSKALNALAKEGHAPDLIISDYHLSSGRTGLDAIDRLRTALSRQIPAFLISGDINPAPLAEARAKGLHVLHKPVSPMALRAMFHQALRRDQHASGNDLPIANS
jgi:CheY-like chemotaxis protein